MMMHLAQICQDKVATLKNLLLHHAGAIAVVLLIMGCKIWIPSQIQLFSVTRILISLILVLQYATFCNMLTSYTLIL